MNTVHAAYRADPQTRLSSEGVVRQDVAGRLVVVVPDIAEAALLAGRIQELAAVRGQEVFMLGVASKAVPESELRRKLALLAAFLHEAGTRAQFQMRNSHDWIPALENLLGENDLLACCVVEGSPSAGVGWLDQVGTRFDRPVYAFMDGEAVVQRGPTLLRRVASWIGSSVIILGFFWLQVQLSQAGGGAAQTDLLLLSLPVEIGMIWLLNSLIG